MGKTMNYLERRLAELSQYRPDPTAPDDLDAFWNRTLQEAAARPLNATREKTGSWSPYAEAYKVTYEGFDDTPIHGWYLLPAFSHGDKLPCAVVYHGYTGSKGYPDQYANWLLLGYAVFAIDIRGQGGETGNLLAQSFGMAKGWMSQGLLDPETHYYRAIAVDALKAVEWAASQPEVDPARIVAAGASQGGGLSLLVAALSDIPSRIVADIPNMCHMDYGILQSTGSLAEAADFVSKHPEQLERTLKTLSYFDLLNLCGRIRKPTFVSVGLKDPICLPETVFAVYNRIEAPKQLQVYPFNGHYTSGDHFSKVAAFLQAASHP